MSLKRTVGVTEGAGISVVRSPSQIADARFRGLGFAQGWTKSTMRFRSMRPPKTSKAMALLRQSSELLRIVFPMMLTTPVAVTGCSGESEPHARTADPDGADATKGMTLVDVVVQDVDSSYDLRSRDVCSRRCRPRRCGERRCP